LACCVGAHALARRFLWSQFQFVTFRELVRHKLRICFTAWRYSKTPYVPTLRLTGPTLTLPQYQQLLRDIGNGLKLEDEWDERVRARWAGGSGA
jgi:hypothetical protein